MTIEVSLLLSGVSIAFAIFFGISTRNRNVKKDTQDEAREDATILTKLENIQNTMIEVKSEMGSYRKRNEGDQGVLHQGIRKPEAASQACG